MTSHIFFCLFGGVSIVCSLLALYVVLKMQPWLFSIEMKILANSLIQQQKLKEQIVGAVDFNLKSAAKRQKKALKKKINL